MIKFTANAADRILMVEMMGMISEADIDNAFDALQPRIADVAPRAVVRIFPPEQRDEALAWLKGK